MKISVLCVAIASIASGMAAKAQDWHYNGFINQTVINSSDNFMFGKTDDKLSLDYRELALVLTGNLAPQIDFSSQLLSRKAGEEDDGTPRVDYAFLSWRFYENLDVTQGLRLGRLKAPIGFYNDSRDSPFTRIGVFLPQSMYVDRTRNYTMQADSLMYFGEWRSDMWNLNWKLAGGKNNPDKKELADFFHLPENTDPSFESRPVWHLQLLAEYDGGRMRFGYTEYDTPAKYTLLPFVDSAPITSEAKTHWRAYSFEYNEALWSFTTEFINGVVNYNGISPDISNPDYRDHPEAAYLQLLWHINDQQSVFIRKEYNYLNRYDADGTDYEQFITAKMAHVTAKDRYGLSNVIGWSYAPAPDWLIRADLYRNTGTLLMTQRDAPDGYQAKLHWDVVALSVAWRF